MDGGQLRSLLRRLDTNGNGSVSMDEFLAFWCPPALPSSETTALVASRPQPVVMSNAKSALASAQQPLLGISVVSHSTNSSPSELSNDSASSATSSRRPPSWLRILNVLCGLFLVAGASVGAEIAGRSIIENEQHIADARQLLPLVLNAWLLLFGAMVVLIEVRYPACVGSCFAHVFDHHFRALDTNIGRGVCYVFAGMVGVQLYQPGLGLLQLLTVFAGLGVIAVGAFGVSSIVVLFTGQVSHMPILCDCELFSLHELSPLVWRLQVSST